MMFEYIIFILVTALAIYKAIDFLILCFKMEDFKMQGKILGGYVFTSKNGKNLVNLTVSEERLNGVGVCCQNIMTMQDALPAALGDMVNKTYVIDCRYGNGGSAFAQSFYQIK